MLIRNATLLDGTSTDVLIADGHIKALEPDLTAPGASRIEAHGHALIPGLRDHHLHLFASAAAARSLRCGPPQVNTRAELQSALRQRTPDATGWIRGVDYHPSIAGELDCALLDEWRGDVPVRIQHAGGRLWCLNSRAMALLGEGPWERLKGQPTGRLYEADAWLRSRLSATPPDLAEVSRRLASFGVVGLTDTSPANDAAALSGLRAQVRSGALLQQVLMMGNASLDQAFSQQKEPAWPDGLRIGAHKFHLLESALPDFGGCADAIRRSHAHGRPVAFHCVSRTELVYALALLRDCGSQAGDRIEHAGVCPDELLGSLLELGLSVVTQPVFIAERGDRYRRDVCADDRPWLYRLRGLRDAGVGLAGSSDAPYGSLNPWLGMAAAVSRLTRDGACLGKAEALTPEDALFLYTGDLLQPGRPRRRLQCGQKADLVLLDRSWELARRNLAEVGCRLSLSSGKPIWQESSGP